MIKAGELDKFPELIQELKNQISSATKEEDLFAGPYERLIDRKFM